MKSELVYAKITHPTDHQIIGNAKVHAHEEGFEIESFTLVLPAVNGEYKPNRFEGDDFDDALREAGFDPHEARIEIEDQIADRRDH